LFAANTKGNDEDVLEITDLSLPVLDARLGERDAASLRDDVELVDGVNGELNIADYRSAK